MTTVEALKNVYVSLGGELTDTHDTIAGEIPVRDYVLIPDVLQAIAGKTESAVSAELPEVNADDNGKVLKVVDGKWAVGTDE